MLINLAAYQKSVKQIKDLYTAVSTVSYKPVLKLDRTAQEK